MLSAIGEHPGHPNLLRNHSRTHLNSLTLELDLDVNAGGEVELHPVSYTHLDVYKRQAMHQALLGGR